MQLLACQWLSVTSHWTSLSGGAVVLSSYLHAKILASYDFDIPEFFVPDYTNERDRAGGGGAAGRG